MNSYRLAIHAEMRALITQSHLTGLNALDFGCGDGWFATQLAQAHGFSNIVGVDVKKRANCSIDPVIYDGGRLPFQDRSFDVVYAVDVLHHCLDPHAALPDLSRCARRFLIIKDHTQTNVLEDWVLQALDWVGNVKFGIPSPGLYQKRFEWDDVLKSLGWSCKTRIHPLKCHTGMLGNMTNALQFMSLYERS